MQVMGACKWFGGVYDIAISLFAGPMLLGLTAYDINSLCEIKLPEYKRKAAVDGCRAGGSILLLPGQHAGPVAIGRELHIFGRGGATLTHGGDDRPTLLIAMSADATCTVAGLSLRRAAGPGGGACVEVSAGAPRLQSCDVVGGPSEKIYKGGIHVAGASARPVVADCRVHDGGRSGLRFTRGAGGRVERCDIWGNANAGVVIEGRGTEPAVVDCK